MTKKIRTIRKVWKKLGQPEANDAKCTEKYLKEIERHIDRWEDYWRSQKNQQANQLPGCKRAHLEEWRRHLSANGFAARTVNKHLGTIRRILIVAEKHELIDRRPRLEQLMEHSGKNKLFLRDEHFDAMFATSDQLQWPNVSIESGVWWKAAMVLYRTYGFRTQELIAYESHKRPITWRNISFASETPNPASDATCEHGWLHYVPPKTKKKKPTPIFLPLTKHARAALDILAKLKQSDDDPICNATRNQWKFYGEWYRWLELSDVKPKSEDAKFNPYCLRKTCATHMNRHRSGLATAVCRWGSSGEAKIASDHYISDELILQDLHTAPMPLCFDSLLTA